jgi:hypothetical protein
MASLDLGLRIECDPLVRDKFSRHVAQPQPDRPAQTVQPGFAFYDEPATLLNRCCSVLKNKRRTPSGSAHS